MSTTIRVSERTRNRLAAIANSTGEPMTEVVERAVEALERRAFFEELNARYEQLRADDAMWTEIETERASEEGTITDFSA